jgi:hypothetical protein
MKNRWMMNLRVEWGDVLMIRKTGEVLWPCHLIEGP